MSQSPTQNPVWKNLQAHQAKMRGVALRELFASDSDRGLRYTVGIKGIDLDLSRNHLTDETLKLLLELAEAQKVADWRDQMFHGDKINVTEKRAVLHTALRDPSSQPVLVDSRNVHAFIKAVQTHMAEFVADVCEGRWLGATGMPIRHVVNIGIGGSDLGPRLVVNALRGHANGLHIHFVANVDVADLYSVLPELDPTTTLFVVVSKTFTTQETLMNAHTARRWLVSHLGASAVAQHFVAVSASPEKAEEFGIAPGNIFTMWDWVGGRYSLWSAVGLSIALAIGWRNFRALLDGAAAMDEHFRTAPLAKNLPVLLGLTGIWYRNFWGTSCHAILPYSERLRELPRFLQQLDMESNGKSVTRDGQPVDYKTGPAIFGECGSVGQHSFHQWLHQGTDLTPVDFIGIRQDDMAQEEHHRTLLAHMNAQAEALMRGRHEQDPARTNPGNRPSSILWLDRLDPYHLGLLLALYEHKVFVQGAVWAINSFDQFGVELGKKLAAEALEGLRF